MSLRRRLVLLCSAAAAIAVVTAAVGSYLAVRDELRDQIDEVLTTQAAELAEFPAGEPFKLPLRKLPEHVGPPLQPPGGAGIEAQLIAPDGTVEALPQSGHPRLPVDEADLVIAEAGEGSRLVDVEADGEPLRVITAPIGDDGAVQIGRSLAGVESVLGGLRFFLALLIAGGIAIAAGLAWLVSRRILAPVASLSDAAEHVTETEDLSRRIAVRGTDELGRLASRFNAMLDTIERSQGELSDSVTAQRQLVADASHELRTPVASLRTDVESLLGHPELDEAERQATLRTADARLMELTALIADVIELARGEERAIEAEGIRFDTLVSEAVERTRDLAPGREFRLELEPSLITAEPDRVARAVNNLLDNACKYSPAGEPIDVRVIDGVLTVRDRGPGIPADELEHVFDRFYRGRQTRGEPGSGLGLAIVSQVARAGGGDAWVKNHADRGSVFSFRPGPLPRVAGVPD